MFCFYKIEKEWTFLRKQMIFLNHTANYTFKIEYYLLLYKPPLTWKVATLDKLA